LKFAALYGMYWQSDFPGLLLSPLHTTTRPFNRKMLKGWFAPLANLATFVPSNNLAILVFGFFLARGMDWRICLPLLFNLTSNEVNPVKAQMENEQCHSDPDFFYFSFSFSFSSSHWRIKMLSDDRDSKALKITLSSVFVTLLETYLLQRHSLARLRTKRKLNTCEPRKCAL
jgi:hypothetical protein